MIEEYSCNRGGIRGRKLTTVHTFCIQNAESRYAECEEKRSVELPMMEDVKLAVGFSRDPARENF
jgi:hypothetical protein